MIPVVTIARRKGHPAHYCEIVLNKHAMKVVNSAEIVFIKKHGEMKLQIPQFDSNKTYKIHNKSRRKGKVYTSPSGRFYVSVENPEDIYGTYSLEKDGDDILLIKNTN